MIEMSPKKILREVLIVYVLVLVTIVALTRFRFIPPFDEYIPVLVGILFLWSATKLAQREPHGPRRAGIDLAGLLAPAEDTQETGLAELWHTLVRAIPIAAREIFFALAVAAIVFPCFVVGFYFWNTPNHAFEWNPADDEGAFILTQLIVVALPEEAFFRGWVQTRLGDAFPKTVRILGTEISVVALVLQAALFALAHFAVDLNPARLAVFFPGLLFGWLRARRGGIGAGIALHAASNVFSDLLTRGFFL